jgi:pimeloyl-ACP methyl ester carboxylesterase
LHFADGMSASSTEVTLAFGHSFRAVEGVRLHWAELGSGHRHVPIVLLHGLNDSYLTWSRVAPTLATDRRVLMPDLPGYGLSERPDASYELAWHAKMIARWLERLGLERFDLVGHSFGGGVAQVMLLECPTRIRRLVLVASGGLGREVSLALRLASLPGVVEHLGQRFMALGTRMVLRGQRAGFLPHEVAELCAMNGSAGAARAFARTVRDVVDWRGQRRTFFQRSRELAQIPPMAIFWGSRDTMIPPSHGKAFADCVGGVTFTLFEDCGHYLHHQRPAGFVRALRAFLDA